jgi:hypothetical protein
VSTTEELLGRNSSGSGIENREYGRGYLLHSPLQKLALISPTSGSRSVSIVRSQTKAIESIFIITRIFMVLVLEPSDVNLLGKEPGPEQGKIIAHIKYLLIIISFICTLADDFPALPGYLIIPILYHTNNILVHQPIFIYIKDYTTTII